MAKQERPIDADDASEKLTAFQQKFIAEYLVDPCATRAVIRAKAPRKISYGAARTEGKRMLTNAHILRELRAGMAAVGRAAKVKAKRVVEGLAKVAFADPLDLFDYDQNGNERTRTMREVPYRMRLAIASVKTRVLSRKLVPQTVNGEELMIEESVVSREVKFNDRVAAQDKLLKMLGEYEAHNHQKHGIKSDAEAEAIRDKLKQRGMTFDVIHAPSTN